MVREHSERRHVRQMSVAPAHSTAHSPGSATPRSTAISAACVCAVACRRRVVVVVSECLAHRQSTPQAWWLCQEVATCVMLTVSAGGLLLDDHDCYYYHRFHPLAYLSYKSPPPASDTTVPCHWQSSCCRQLPWLP